MALEREKGRGDTAREWKDRSRELAKLRKKPQSHHFCSLKLVSLQDAKVAMQHTDNMFFLRAGYFL